MAASAPQPLGWLTKWWVLPAVVIAGLAIRVALLPAGGFADDIDQFVIWVGHISRAGLAHAYDTPLSFGPVMVFVWWLLGLVDPAIVSSGSGADLGVRMVMKLPAVAADLALAGVVWWGLRQRPAWATAALALVLLHPAVWFVSAWWGTYDSVYAAFGVAAFVFAIRDRNGLAVVMLVLAIMAKPQAAPLAFAFGAWFLARAGWRAPDGSAAPGRAIGRLFVWGGVALATLFALWLPFLAAAGPTKYLAALALYQGETFAVLSISAWNPWWILQELLANRNYITDSSALVAGVSFRLIGYILTFASLAAIAVFVVRRPTPRQLALGLAASVLVSFELLTTMHERYAFMVLPLVAFLLDERRMRWFATIFGVIITLNLVSAPHQYLGEVLPFHGPLTVVGSVLCFAATLFLVVELIRGASQPEPRSVVNEAAMEAGGASRRGTSAGNAGATSAA
jgi:hypothetical protein